LGNVLAVITDNKFIAPPSGAGGLGVFVAQVITTQDYYAYGLPMAKRSFNNTNYFPPLSVSSLTIRYVRQA
jgi:hypothetical protein